MAARSPGLRGANPSNVNRSVGRPDTARAVSTALGPGIDGHDDARGRRGRDQPVAGVAHGGHAGVAEHEDVTGPRQFDELGSPLLLVVVVERDQAGPVGDAERGQQPLCGAGVLGRDDGGVLERVDQAPRGVPQVSDGGRGKDDHAPSLDLTG